METGGSGSGGNYSSTAPVAVELNNNALAPVRGRKGEISNAVKLYTFCAAVNSCNLGYDIGVTTNVGPLVKDDLGLSDVQLELFVGSINLWSIFGALSSQYFSDRYGRRATFILADNLFIIGCIVMSSSTTYALLMFGRVFVGLGVGVGLAIDPLYIAEIAPSEHRGYLVTWSEFALNIGIVLGFSTGLLLSSLPNNTEWRFMILLGAIMPIIMIFLVLRVMPESPRWLVSKNDDINAKIVLETIYSSQDDVDVDAIITNIKQSLERERVASNSMGWGAIFLNPTPAIKRMVLIGVFTAASQQLAGIDAIQYYLNIILGNIFNGSGGDTMQSVALIVLGIIKLVCIVVGGKLFDVVGRRPLLFTSLIGCSASLFLVSLTFFFSPTVGEASSGLMILSLIGLALYLAFFSIGLGPGAWLIPSEIFALSIRAKAMSLATCVNRVIATIYSSSFLSVANLIGWDELFFVMSISCIVLCKILHLYLPETKDKSLEDMSLYFAQITNDDSILEAEQRIKSASSLESSELEIPNVQSGGTLNNNNNSGTLT